jgi:hypothetical protein
MTMPTLAFAKKDEPAVSTRIDELAHDLSAAVEQLVRDGNPDGLSDEALRQVFASIVKLFAAKAEAADFSDDFVPYSPEAVTATQTVVTACAMIRAADLNMFDVAMWFARRAAARD